MKNNSKNKAYKSKSENGNFKTKTNGEIKLAVEEKSELLKFLREKMPQKPNGKIKSLLEHGCVKIDGVVTTKFNAPLKLGQVVTVITTAPKYSPKTEKADTLPIIFEDDEILVINKPAGLLSIATETEKEKTAYHIMTEYVKSKNINNRLFIVHRLDRETSGVLLFAKNEQIKALFQDNWNELVKCRGYIAVVEGKLAKKQDRIVSYLRETDSHLVYSATRDKNGKLAITNYTVIKESEDYSTLKIELETGRKNQIRVHLKELGHPILGDKKYGSHCNVIKRLALHSDRLEVLHPITNEVLKFKAPTPRQFSKIQF